MNIKKLIRAQFRSDVFERDNYTCLVCGKKHKDASTLNSHHITDRNLMPKGGYIKENGVTVCEEPCHMLVEKYHISSGKEWEPGFHPSDLYKMIDSSYEKAYNLSKKICI